jgi:UDP-glucose 4-epimerase
MRVLVTGGAGFIGSHLCDGLLERGHSVVAVDDLSLGREENVAHLAGRSDFDFVELSIFAPEFDGLVAGSCFDAVFHMAANSDIQAGSRDRRVDLERTFLTTWNVCESMARHGIHRLVFASTSAIYGEVHEATSEDHGPLIPVSFYGAAKLASEAFCSAYSARHGIQTWVYRFPNVVGSRATHGVILDFVRKLQATPDVLEVLGDGTQCKPYLHVQDLIEAMLLGFEKAKPDPYEVFNIGPESKTTVREIAEAVVKSMGLEGRAAIRYGSDPIGWPGDVPTFAYELKKIHGLGWRARFDSGGAMRQGVLDVVAEQAGT